jgi:hypothetical protein
MAPDLIVASYQISEKVLSRIQRKVFIPLSLVSSESPTRRGDIQ